MCVSAVKNKSTWVGRDNQSSGPESLICQCGSECNIPVEVTAIAQEKEKKLKSCACNTILSFVLLEKQLADLSDFVPPFQPLSYLFLRTVMCPTHMLLYYTWILSVPPLAHA